MAVKNYFPATESTPVDAGGGLTRKVGAWNANVMVVEVQLETGTVAARPIGGGFGRRVSQ